MKIYCNKCKKVFEAEKPANGDSVECTHCKEKIPFPKTPTSPGAVIGDFVIERELSKGGMGEVYLARQISLDRSVALKVLQAKFLNDKEYVESFFREARAAGRINHPNVVQAYAVGEENGVFYFAMEYIRGKTMKEILKEKKVLDFVEAAKIIKEVAGALECAWRDEKLVHQDIKPDNIMLDANGFAKLADLGLARVAGNNDKEASEGEEVLGTPQYISLEQLTGVPTDVRSDIYSLGATFYQFVTGRFPYVAETAEEIAKLHVAGHLQPPKEVNPTLPDELNTIITKMMARKIEDRYQTPTPLIKALDMFLSNTNSRKNAIPTLNLRFPKPPPAAAGTGLKASPVADKNVKKTAAPLPKANPPTAPKSPIPRANPPVAPKSAIPRATPPIAKNNGQVAASETAKKEEVKPNNGKAANNDDLAIKVVEKPETTPATPPEEAKDQGKKKKKEKSDKEKSVVFKKVITLILGLVFLLFIIVGGAIGLYFLAAGDKLPESLKPFGTKVVAFAKERVSPLLPGNPLNDSSAETGQSAEPSPPPPPKIVTRPEYMANIENLLQMRRSEPDNYLGFLRAADKLFDEGVKPQTQEESKALETLQLVYYQVDERARVAPAREAARQKFLAELKVRHDADDAEKKALAAKIEEEKQKKAQAEAEARRIEQEKAQKAAAEAISAKNRLIGIHSKLNPLLEDVAVTFFSAIRHGERAGFDRAIGALQLFEFPPGKSEEETKLLNEVLVYGTELPPEVDKMRKFAETLQQITPENNSFTIETPSRDLITVTGISSVGVSAVDGSGKPVGFDLTNARLRGAIIKRLERRMKLEDPAFYLDMLTGNFSAATAQEAAKRKFWKTYYRPFMTSYFKKLWTNADAATRSKLEARYGKLPEFSAAK
ncbi:MAG: protein kinase [Victivallales bacterium]|jgi:serine/threonine-protein kinase|nr:protein kinase [Victivallales bacterium]